MNTWIMRRSNACALMVRAGTLRSISPGQRCEECKQKCAASLIGVWQTMPATVSLSLRPVPSCNPPASGTMGEVKMMVSASQDVQPLHPSLFDRPWLKKYNRLEKREKNKSLFYLLRLCFLCGAKLIGVMAFMDSSLGCCRGRSIHHYRHEWAWDETSAPGHITLCL